MLGITAGMDQKDICPRRTGYWFFWEMTSVDFRIQRSAWFDSGYMHCVIPRCSLSRCAPYSVLSFVRLRIHAMRQPTRIFGRISHIFYLLRWIRFLRSIVDLGASLFSAMLGSTLAFGALRCRVVVTVSLRMVLTILHGTT